MKRMYLGAVVFVCSMCLAGFAYAWGDDWGGGNSTVQESSGFGWQSSGNATNDGETRLVIQSAPEAGIAVEAVTITADTACLASGFQLFCASSSLISIQDFLLDGTWLEEGKKFHVSDSQGEGKYLKEEEAWFVGTGSVSAPALVSFKGKPSFDKVAVRADNLMDTGIDSKEEAWGVDFDLNCVLFAATSGTFFENYRTREGNFLGAKEADVYLFSSARVPIEEGGIADVPNVITKFSNLEEQGDVNRYDCGFYENVWHYSNGLDEERAYYTVDDPDNMITKVQLEDGSAAAMVSIGQLSSIVDNDKIAVLDARGNTWYVDEGDIEENEDMAVLYQIFTQ